MAKTKRELRHEMMKEKIVKIAGKNFFKHGFLNTPIKAITTEVGIGTSSFNNIFQTKEDILCELVYVVMKKQFEVTTKLLKGKTDDKLLFFACETVLQLHIAEYNENVRDVYMAAYSFLKPARVIQKAVSEKWAQLFKEYLPNHTASDFFKLEIATGGIIRGFITIPCDIWFTMEQKVKAFLECSLKLYDVSQSKIEECVEFVKQIDFEQIAKETIFELLKYFDE